MIAYLFISLMVFVQAYSDIPKSFEMSAEKEEVGEQNSGSEFNLKAFPSSVVHSVSVISGQFVETDKDYRVVCPVPLTYERGVDSQEFGNGWLSNFNDYVHFTKIKRENGRSHDYRLEYIREFGEKLYFGTKQHRHDFKDRLVDDEQLEQGFTNFHGDEVSAHSNLRNVSLHYDYKKDPNKIWVELGDGTRKYFSGDETFFSLKKIERPDGNAIIYDYHEYKAVNRLGEVLGWIKIEDSPRHCIVRGSDGRHVIYGKSDYYYTVEFGAGRTFTGITYVNRSDAPPVSYTYYGDNELIRCMRSKYLPDNRYTEYLYYTKGDHIWQGKKEKVRNRDITHRRVKNINAPLGTDPSPKPMYSFWYKSEKHDETGFTGGITTVIDALGRKKLYHYRNRKLTHIEHFDGAQLAYSDEIEWGREKHNENTNLKKRLVKDKNGNVLLSKEIVYDEKHNPVRETVKGNWRGYGFGVQDLTVEKAFSKDRFNLLVREKDEERTVEYTYHPNTNKMASKTIKGHDGILIRSFYEYDKNGVLSKETIDDGENYSERRIKKIESNMQGLPVDVCEYYLDEGQEVLKSREVNTYNPIGRLIKREVYDSNNVLATVEEWEYDGMGNITLEKNALGVIVRRHYDFNGNMIRKEGPLPTQVETYSYDFMNRLIKHEEKIGSLTLSTHYGYDLCGNRTYQIDRSGHKTTYEYNFLNQKVKSVLPDGAVLKSEYDIFGNTLVEFDGEGNKTARAYTSSGKPYHIIYPDGSEEKYVYDLKGRVTKKIHKNGLITSYERDSLGRVLNTIDEHEGKILSKTSATYNAFHCLSETDAAGITTFYTYNKAGQKVKEQKRGHIVEFAYDSLGRLSHTYTDDNISIVSYDALNQVIEEKLVGIAGNLLSHIKKQYDETGHLIYKATRSERDWDIETYLYNERGELIEATNALGEKTLHHYEYTDNGLQHITVDPQGIRLITCLDYAGKITRYERQNALERRSRNGNSPTTLI